MNKVCKTCGGFDICIIGHAGRTADCPEWRPKWIPVSEMLPDEEAKVLVCTKHTHAETVGTYTKRYGFGMSEGFILGDGFMPTRLITHWMPLPEPPKED